MPAPENGGRHGGVSTSHEDPLLSRGGPDGQFGMVEYTRSQWGHEQSGHAPGRAAMGKGAVSSSGRYTLRGKGERRLR